MDKRKKKAWLALDCVFFVVLCVLRHNIFVAFATFISHLQWVRAMVDERREEAPSQHGSDAAWLRHLDAPRHATSSVVLSLSGTTTAMVAMTLPTGRARAFQLPKTHYLVLFSFFFGSHLLESANIFCWVRVFVPFRVIVDGFVQGGVSRRRWRFRARFFFGCAKCSPGPRAVQRSMLCLRGCWATTLAIATRTKQAKNWYRCGVCARGV